VHLRVVYLGTRLAFALEAASAEHKQRGHFVTTCKLVTDIPLNPTPDVVIHHPLNSMGGGFEGTCRLSSILSKNTLLVAVFPLTGPSHAMFAFHALKGRCHPRVVLYLLPEDRCFSSDEFVGLIETAVSRNGHVVTTESFPDSLRLKASRDLGEVMSRRGRTGELLYRAASDPTWGNWSELSRRLNMSEGSVKNLNTKLGQELKRIGLVDPGQDWGMTAFTRLITAHRSFILAYGQGHLNFDPPINSSD